jgi:hypothetical protein
MQSSGTNSAKPTFAAVTNLRKELCENAMSVRSTQGGQCGHLSMAMPPNKHVATPGAQPWADPQNPGALQIPANAVARQMALLSDTHNRQVKEHNTCVDLAAKLKQQILDAVDHTQIGMAHRLQTCESFGLFTDRLSFTRGEKARVRSKVTSAVTWWEKMRPH